MGSPPGGGPTPGGTAPAPYPPPGRAARARAAAGDSDATRAGLSDDGYCIRGDQGFTRGGVTEGTGRVQLPRREDAWTGGVTGTRETDKKGEEGEQGNKMGQRSGEAKRQEAGGGGAQGRCVRGQH